ncbi:MAG TPA: transposase [Gaiellaceae bacterium]
MNKLRLEEPGATYHLCANAIDGRRLFHDEVDFGTYFGLLGDEVVESEWELLEYVFMTTHVHLIVKLRKCTLSSGFRRLQSRYARAFNRRHRRRGVMWQKRFHDEMIETDGHLFEAIRYVARNPVRAGMCDAPEDYEWSSYGAAIGVHPRDPLVSERALLELFARDAGTARRRLRAFVEEKDPRVRRRQTRVRRASDGEK